VIHNRTYRGEVRSGAYRNSQAHAALIDEVTWQLAQRPNTIPRANERTPALLTGIVRCASCRGALSPEHQRRARGRRVQLYLCHKKSVRGYCAAPTSIVSDRIDPYIQLLFFRALTYPPPEVDYRRKQRRKRQRALEAAEHALEAFRDDERIEDVLGRDQFVLGLRIRALKVDETRRELAFAEQAANTPPIPPVAELRRDWPDLSISERRLYISRVIDCVFVRPGRVSVEERCWTLYRGQGPDDLPRAGRDTKPHLPYDPPNHAGWWTEHWQPNLRWDHQKAEAELRELLRGRDEWPPPSEFYASEKSALLDYIYHHGGSIAWARRMGVYPCGRRRWGD
jgi:hypothetical protein